VAYALAQPDRAAEHFARAANIFRELGARLDLAQTEEAGAALDGSTVEQSRRSETIAQLLTLRLAEAVASRELLLHELAAVIRQETNCESVVILEPHLDATQRVVIAHGLDQRESAALATRFAAVQNNAQTRISGQKA